MEIQKIIRNKGAKMRNLIVNLGRMKNMRILSFYPTKTLKLIIEFENNEYRILDIQKVEELKKYFCNDIDLFRLN